MAANKNCPDLAPDPIHVGLYGLVHWRGNPDLVKWALTSDVYRALVSVMRTTLRPAALAPGVQAVDAIVAAIEYGRALGHEDALRVLMQLRHPHKTVRPIEPSYPQTLNPSEE